MPTWATVRESKLTAGESGDRQRSPLEAAMSLAARAGLTTRRVTTALDALGLTPVVRRVLPRGLARAGAEAGAEQVDFPASTAFVRSRSELGVRINLRGREPDGVVSPEEYEAVRSDLVDLLSAVRTPDGDPVFEDVAPREEYFSGPRVEDAVDVVTVPNRFDQFFTARLGPGPFGQPSEPWTHKRDGVIVAAGADVDAEASLSGAHLFDVAPTVLALFDHPRPRRMDGTVLPAVDSVGDGEYADAAPVDAGPDASTADQAVATRLAELGYIEDR